ncbi:MAG TPA: hypothetical protein VG759_16905 [Candidatus Angelobacter sp.]|jgi:hypothetical protein|nr:hypothetical protein [Candidatus Angelobacter sp.]
MVSISTRIWAGVLSVALLSLTAVAGDKDANAPTNKTAATGTATTTATPAANTAPAAGLGATTDPLLRLLVNKGILSAIEANSLMSAPANQMQGRLLLLLKDKGVLSAEELGSLNSAPAATANNAQPAATSAAVANASVATVDPPQPPQTAPSGPVPAIAPIRVLAVDPPKREGVIPVISIGKNIHLQPYGFVKVSAVYDTSSPYGNDFPLPGFNPITNGPDTLSEFHLKDRATRLGTSFEWLDISPNIVLTGKVELDMEGNFERANNRNISSVRSNMPSLRLAYGRVDWHTSDATTFHLLAGQDWTPFGSSTLPNLFEQTGLGVGFGTLYERDPQIRVGFNHKLGGGRNFALEPEVAMVFPAYGNLPADLTVQSGPLAGTPVPGNEGVANQLGYGERQGADSSRPEIQARLVAQFQLDKAPGVAPAQIIVSGVNSSRNAVVLANQVPAAFQAAFPRGARIGSKRNAWTGEIQLPTRWFTLIAKYYNGTDLRYYFAGQIFAEFNDTTGLINTATAQTIDGASTLVFGCRGGVGAACTGGSLVVANQLPARSQGGFVNLGLPLSRWANADPSGRNAGWSMYLHYGYDQVLARDVRRLGGGREKGDLAAGTIQYKLNNYLTFIVEESLYRTRAIPLTATGLFPAFAGRPMREWKDFRSEIGPVFTF